MPVKASAEVKPFISSEMDYRGICPRLTLSLRSQSLKGRGNFHPTCPVRPTELLHAGYEYILQDSLTYFSVHPSPFPMRG